MSLDTKPCSSKVSDLERGEERRAVVMERKSEMEREKDRERGERK